MTLEFKRILVPLDFSAGSARALDYAYAMALKFEASLHLIPPRTDRREARA